MSVPVSTGVSVTPVSPQVLSAQVWAKLSSEVRARAVGLFAQLALNLVVARTRGDASRAARSSARKEGGRDACAAQHRQDPR
jgi:hypothetical protein